MLPLHAGCYLFKDKDPAITHPLGSHTKSTDLKFQAPSPTCFTNSNSASLVKRYGISLLFVSFLFQERISLPYPCTQLPPPCRQPPSIFLTFLTFQMQLLLYIYVEFVPPVFRLLSALLLWMWMISSCKCGTG